jgi:hypothetical protein
MAAAWPVSLQEKLSEQGFGIQHGDTTLRSDMDIGPAKVRRRFTRGIDKLSCSIWLTTSEYSTFRYFYDTTLNGGVNRFEFNHPITGTLTEFRFADNPKYSSLGGGHFSVSMQWEEMP